MSMLHFMYFILQTNLITLVKLRTKNGFDNKLICKFLIGAAFELPNFVRGWKFRLDEVVVGLFVHVFITWYPVEMYCIVLNIGYRWWQQQFGMCG